MNSLRRTVHGSSNSCLRVPNFTVDSLACNLNHLTGTLLCQNGEAAD